MVGPFVPCTDPTEAPLAGSASARKLATGHVTGYRPEAPWVAGAGRANAARRGSGSGPAPRSPHWLLEVTGNYHPHPPAGRGHTGPSLSVPRSPVWRRCLKSGPLRANRPEQWMRSRRFSIHWRLI